MNNKYKVSLLAASVFMAVSVSAAAADATPTTVQLSDILTSAEQTTALSNLQQTNDNIKAFTELDKRLAEKLSDPATNKLLQQYLYIGDEQQKTLALKNKATIAAGLASQYSSASGKALFTGSGAFNAATAGFVVTAQSDTGTTAKDKDFAIANPFTLSTGLADTAGALFSYNSALHNYVDKVATVYQLAKTAADDVHTTLTGTDATKAQTLADKIMGIESINKNPFTKDADIVSGTTTPRWADKDALAAWITSATSDADKGVVQALGKALSYYAGMDRWQTVVENVDEFRGNTIENFISLADTVSQNAPEIAVVNPLAPGGDPVSSEGGDGSLNPSVSASDDSTPHQDQVDPGVANHDSENKNPSAENNEGAGDNADNPPKKNTDTDLVKNPPENPPPPPKENVSENPEAPTENQAGGGGNSGDGNTPVKNGGVPAGNDAETDNKTVNTPPPASELNQNSNADGNDGDKKIVNVDTTNTTNDVIENDPNKTPPPGPGEKLAIDAPVLMLRADTAADTAISTPNPLSTLKEKIKGYHEALTAAEASGWADPTLLNKPASLKAVAEALHVVLDAATAAQDAEGAEALKTLMTSDDFATAVKNPVDNLQKAAQGFAKHHEALDNFVKSFGEDDKDLAEWQKLINESSLDRKDEEEVTRKLLDDYITTLVAIGQQSETKAIELTNAGIGDGNKTGYDTESTKLKDAQSALEKAQSIFRSQYAAYLAAKADEKAAEKANTAANNFLTDNKDPFIKDIKDLGTTLDTIRPDVKTLTSALFGIADPSSAPTGKDDGLQTTLRNVYDTKIAAIAGASDADKSALIINAAKALAYLYDDTGAAVPPVPDGAAQNMAPLSATVFSALNYYIRSFPFTKESVAQADTVFSLTPSDILLKDIVDFVAAGPDSVDPAKTLAETTYNNARQAYLTLLTADAAKTETDISDLTNSANITALKDKLSADEITALDKAEAAVLLAASNPTATAPVTLTSLLAADNKTLKTAEELNKDPSTAFVAAAPDYTTVLNDKKKAYNDQFNTPRQVGSMAGQAADIYGKLQSWNSPVEQQQAYFSYISMLQKPFTQTLPALADQKDPGKNPDHLSKTLYLGSLSAHELATMDSNGDLRKLSVLPGKDVASSLTFDEKVLYTGDKDHRMTTTALHIAAPKVTASTITGLADQKLRTLTVGGTDATHMLDVYTKTYNASKEQRAGKDPVLTDKLHYLDSANRSEDIRGPAVILAGDLNIGSAANAAAGVNEVAADKLRLQFINIDNSVSMADLLKDNGLQRAEVAGLLINSNTVRTVAGDADHPGNLINQQLPEAPKTANIELDNVNITVNNAGLAASNTPDPAHPGQMLDDASTTAAIGLTGSANHLSITGNVDSPNTISATGTKAYALVFIDGSFDGNGNPTHSMNNIVDISNMKITGDIADEHGADAAGNPNSNTVNLTKSDFTGDVTSLSTKDIQGSRNYLALNLKDSHWTGASYHSPDMTFDNSIVNLTRDSSANSLTLAGINTINMISPADPNSSGDPLQSRTLTIEQDLQADDASQTVINMGSNDSITVNHLITGGGKVALAVTGLKSGDEPGETGIDSHPFVTYLTKETRKVKDSEGNEAEKEVKSASDIFSSSPAIELGVWQYQPKAKDDQTTGTTSVYFESNGQLSSGATTVASLAAAPASVAAMETDALDKHISSLRHSDGSGVWISYYGGSNKNTPKSGALYRVKTSGVMLGADTSFGQQWLAGVAFTSGKSTLNVLNSSGDLNNYGAQFWLSRIYDNGVFINSGAQFGHYSNSAKIRLQNGDQARGDYATNGYGLNVKLGYTWENSGFYAEPYVQADARVFSGTIYRLNNDMIVSSTDYKSFTGEIGTDLGYTVPVSTGYIKPYLHLAVLNEFASDNHITVNNVRLPNSIDGAAFRVGAGGEVKLTQNLGGYASFDYTKGGHIERPWQVNVGINYTW